MKNFLLRQEEIQFEQAHVELRKKEKKKMGIDGIWRITHFLLQTDIWNTRWQSFHQDTCITLKAASFLMASTCAYVWWYITYLSFKFSFTYDITALTKLVNSQSQFADQILPKINNIFHLPFIDKSY